MTEVITEFEKLPLHRVAASEGSAIAMAIGYWLQTHRPAHVYLQNSGLLSAGNPLLALAHRNVYDIPLSMTVGWRGQPVKDSAVKDEPQHLATGQMTKELLHQFDFEVQIIESQEQYLEVLTQAVQNKASRTALLVPRGILDRRIEPLKSKTQGGIFTNDAVLAISRGFSGSHVFVSGTGYMSRDLANSLELGSTQNDKAFLLVGGMGYVAPVAAGISLHPRGERLCAIEGDGGAMMNLGGIATLSDVQGTSIDLFILRNGVHASVGGQKVVSTNFDFEIFARACGFRNVASVSTPRALSDRLKALRQNPSPEVTVTVVKCQEPKMRTPSPRPSRLSDLARKFK
ncbi:MAG: hypothetical protein JXR02_02365 [Aquiluna sp.]